VIGFEARDELGSAKERQTNDSPCAPAVDAIPRHSHPTSAGSSTLGKNESKSLLPQLRPVPMTEGDVGGLTSPTVQLRFAAHR
jgi:hypothetical protein